MKKFSDDKMSLSSVVAFPSAEKAKAKKCLKYLCAYFDDIEAESVEFKIHVNEFGGHNIYAPGSIGTQTPLWREIHAYVAGFCSGA